MVQILLPYVCTSLSPLCFHPWQAQCRKQSFVVLALLKSYTNSLPSSSSRSTLTNAHAQAQARRLDRTRTQLECASSRKGVEACQVPAVAAGGGVQARGHSQASKPWCSSRQKNTL